MRCTKNDKLCLPLRLNVGGVSFHGLPVSYRGGAIDGVKDGIGSYGRAC